MKGSLLEKPHLSYCLFTILLIVLFVAAQALCVSDTLFPSDLCFPNEKINTAKQSYSCARVGFMLCFL